LQHCDLISDSIQETGDLILKLFEASIRYLVINVNKMGMICADPVGWLSKSSYSARRLMLSWTTKSVWQWQALTNNCF